MFTKYKLQDSRRSRARRVAALVVMTIFSLGLSGQSQAASLDPNFSPLHEAAQKGDTEIVRQLIAERVHIDTKDFYGRTPLHAAAENGQSEAAELLVKTGADIEARTKLSNLFFGELKCREDVLPSLRKKRR